MERVAAKHDSPTKDRLFRYGEGRLEVDADTLVCDVAEREDKENGVDVWGERLPCTSPGTSGGLRINGVLVGGGTYIFSPVSAGTAHMHRMSSTSGSGGTK